MTDTMYDAVDPQNIWDACREPQLVGAYVNGDYAWPDEAYNLFPRSIKNLIAVEFDAAGRWKLANTADVENGAMRPADARTFLDYRQGIHKPGNTIYCSRANLEAVWVACEGHAYYIWVADWTGEEHQVPGTIATQYQCAGNLYDLSAVYSREWVEAIDAANRPWPLAA